jgi:hypothetical protein
MTEQEVQAFCANNGVSVSPPDQPLHVVDPESLPPSVRKFVNNDGTYKGNDTPEAEDPRHEKSKGEPNADPNAVRKMPMDTSEEVEERESAIEEDTTQEQKAAKKATKKASKKASKKK